MTFEIESRSPMHRLLLFLAMEMVHLASLVMADSPTPVSSDGSSQDVVTAFKPSLGVVIGILSVMFSLTFIILVYAKFCHSAAAARHLQRGTFGGLTRTRSQLSGIDKKVIESLPFFRFSALKGSKQGLECAVCLSKFEDIEMLRLLPVCQHAFHVSCIDQWLEKHSSCPLCRHKISSTDPQVFAYSDSLRFLQCESEGRADSNMEIFIEREENSESGHLGYSSRFGIGSSFRTPKKGDKESLIEMDDFDGSEEPRQLHRFNHKIVVSDVVFKNRWSSVTSSDLMFLNSELLKATASDRLFWVDPNNSRSGNEIMEEEEEVSFSGNRKSLIGQSEKRSMSEITGMSRLRGLKVERNRLKGTNFTNDGANEERRRRIWFPIARRTVQWFANRENRRKHNWADNKNKNTRQNLEV